MKNSFKIHLETVHLGKNHTLANAGGLQYHKFKVHDGRRPFKCSSCESSFIEKSKLLHHTISVHEGRKLFQCTMSTI